MTNGAQFNPTTAAVSKTTTITEPVTGILSAGTHVFAINNASSPRDPCIHELSGRAAGCTACSNQRHDDLTYDGKYI
jgi:hypothetical protein